MAKTAILKVRIISDGSGSGAGFKSATSNLDKFEAKVESASRVAAVAGGVVLVLGAKAVQAASNLEQAAGAVDSVFKGQAAAVHQLGENAANAVGLSSRAYQESAAVLGAQLQNLGFAGDQLVGTTDSLIALGADLAAPAAVDATIGGNAGHGGAMVIDWYFDFISPFAYLQLPYLRGLRERVLPRFHQVLSASQTC